MAEKADSELVRRQNRRLVLAALRSHGASARVELGRMTGLSPASLTTISAQLIAEGIISEENSSTLSPPSGKRGRPVVRLALQPKAALVVAIKIAIDEVTIVLTDFCGTIIARNEIKTPTYSVDRNKFGDLLATEIEKFLTKLNVRPGDVNRIGVAVQGLADNRTGSIVWSPAFASGDIPVAAPIEARLSIPCFVANDANMMAEGLVSTNKIRQSGVTVAIFTGYGVGMGIVIDGQVFNGSTGAAAEFGHMNHIPDGALCRCGRKGCTEAYVADYGILRHYHNETESAAPRTAVPDSTLAALRDLAKAGDPQARSAFEGAGSALGHGIGRVIAILNPDHVVLAVAGPEIVELLEPAMRRALESSLVEVLRRSVEIEQIRFGDDLILRGTIDSLLRNIDKDVFAAAPSAA